MRLNTDPGKRVLAWGVVLLCFSGFLGCAEDKLFQNGIAYDEWKARAEGARGHSPAAQERVPPEAGATPEKTAAPPGAGAPAEPRSQPAGKQVMGRPLPATRVSLRMNDVDVAVLLRALARSADQNIMVNERVKGRGTLNIQEAPWDQVFLSILNANALTYRWEGDILRIITKEDVETELALLEAEHKKKEYDLRMKTLESQAEMAQPLVSRVVKVNYADPKALRGNLWEFLKVSRTTSTPAGGGPEQPPAAGEVRGTILVDEFTNSLLIHATGKDMENLLSLIDQLDRPTPQILIESHIVETSKETARELGIQWGGVFHGNSGGDNYWLTPGANTTGALGGSVNNPVDPGSGLASNFPAGSVTPGSAGMTLGFLSQKLGDYLLNVQLSALQRMGKLNILSSPSITTLDNQSATIESGKEVPFQAVTGTGSNQTVEIQWKKAVLSLEVTPHVIDGEMLKMKIKTYKDELDFNNTVGGFPTIITKNAETNVMVFDGQTTVIGGLSKETAGGGNTGVPWLMDIPVLGHLFKSSEKRNEMEEVLIFITPRVLEARRTAGFPTAQAATPKQAGSGPAALVPTDPPPPAAAK